MQQLEQQSSCISANLIFDFIATPNNCRPLDRLCPTEQLPPPNYEQFHSNDEQRNIGNALKRILTKYCPVGADESGYVNITCHLARESRIDQFSGSRNKVAHQFLSILPAEHGKKLQPLRKSIVTATRGFTIICAVIS